ncbi:MAG TPA: hypothetical protein VM737_07880 [Gemmatimonadota bacterium]|nr:hypothetical protein [Gemmatimonadota bacterium]
MTVPAERLRSRILVLSSCTREKSVDDPRRLVQADFRRGRHHVARRERELSDLLTPAERLYAGPSHVALMAGIAACRASAGLCVELWILSAGYGLIPGDRPLAPYDCTFTGMGPEELRDWARRLRIPSAVRRVLAGPYDLGLVLFEGDYLTAATLEDGVALGGPVVFVCPIRDRPRIPDLPGARVVTLPDAEAEEAHEIAGRAAEAILSDLATGLFVGQLLTRLEIDDLGEITG